MTQDVAAIGIKVDTDGVERGIKSLEQLIGVGPKVEQSMDRVNAGARKAGQGLRGIDGDDAARELGRVSGAAQKLGGALTAISATAAALAVREISGAAKEMFSELYAASAQLERFKIGLDFASGGNGAAELQYLRNITKDLGLEFASTAQAYQGFQAAAKGTALEGQKAKDVFESIAKASAVMGLSADQSSGVLLALQQMVSKGTVQAEELRGQLGERLPGAFQIAAKAMGVTTAELGKMLEQGQVVADDFLPKFADALNKHLGDAAEKAANRLDAATNRYASAMDRMKANLGDSGVSQFWEGQINILTDAMDDVSLSMEQARKDGDGFTGQMLSAAGAVMRFLNPVNAVSYEVQNVSVKLKEAEDRLAALAARGAQKSSNLMLREAYNDAQRYVNKLREAKAAQDALTGTVSTSEALRDAEAGNTRGNRVNYYRELNAAQQKLLDISARDNGITKQFTDDLNTYAKALEVGAMSHEQYTAAVTKLNAERAKSLQRRNGGNDGARDADRLNAALHQSAVAQIQSSLRELTSAYSVSESVMEASRSAGLMSEKEYYDAKRSFIELNKQAQLSALAEENAALQAQSLAGAEAVARDQRIAENRSEMARIALEATGKLQVLNIEQTASAKQQEAALLAAKQAADEYIDSISRASSIAVRGVGRGDRWRSDEQGRLGVADRFANDRRDLANQRALAEMQAGGALTAEVAKQYDDRLAIITAAEQQALAVYEQGVAARIAAESDWRNGATRAWENYADTAANVAESTASLFTKAFQGMEDALVSFAMTGKMDFTSLANSIIADIIRIQIRAAMVGSDGQGGLLGTVMNGVMSMFGGGAAATATSGGNAGQGLKMPKNLWTGGYTGDGGKYEPAGIVHKGEYVINAAATKRLGLGYLNSLNGYANGGLVGGGGSAAAPGQIAKVEIINNGEPMRVQSASLEAGVMRVVVEQAAALAAPMAVRAAASQVAGRHGDMHQALLQRDRG
ncbi:phage tail tape measure protein [Comamonas kerstersii]|uniref:Phage tail tape measure protein n=1 Tax=Comamonas kerstersii TaxID=225992 RepID=A0A6A1R1F9_9BURK|nr:phage tail tape measure protein [Comamonas kerstersii]KAB0586187.1 phage tail tape measure protein [Comamonas kerstersii]